MTEYINIAIPSKPKKIEETDTKGVYEIAGLYPGYGNTLGNALRRMLISSMPGAAIATIRIRGIPHEISTIDGVKEDALTIIINMKNIRLKAETDTFPQTITLNKKGRGIVTAGEFEAPTRIEVVNKDMVIAEITDDATELNIEADVYKGIGFRPREDFSEEDTAADSIVVDTIFSPVKRSTYEVHNMRVGDRTDFNRLTISIETDGTITPKEALEKALRTMIAQFEAMLGFQTSDKEKKEGAGKEIGENDISLNDLKLSAIIVSTLEKNNINTVSDILKKGIAGIREIQGIGPKAVQEIIGRLEEQGITLKEQV